MRSLKIILAAFLGLALPAVALAQTSSSPDISSLIAELTALEQQITALTGSTTTTAATEASSASSPVQTSGGLCPDLSRSLSLGESGADVAGLQAYLASENLFSGIATGYFGTLTQEAVAAWQEKNGVVSGGDAATTGLGVVGPLTRSAMDASCQPGQTTTRPTQCLNVQPPSAECANGWQPVTDTSGCTVYYQCTIALPTSSSVGATTTVSSPATTSCPVVQKPVCSGTVQPFQTNAEGCVTGYECIL